MAADGSVTREELARQAEKHLRQGRTDLAIELYERLAQLPPTDWNTIKQLADLLERAGQREAAAGRFLQCADYHFQDGFHAKAAALYRKVLKLEPQSEHALSQLAEVLLAQKLVMEARQALSQVLTLRQRRGDTGGAAAVSSRLAELEPEDARGRQATAAAPIAPPIAAPIAAAPVVATAPEDVSARLRLLAEESEARGDVGAAHRTWLAVLQREPEDVELRRRLIRACLDQRDVDAASTLVEPLGFDAAGDLALRYEVVSSAGQGHSAHGLAARVTRYDAAPETVHDVRDILRGRDAAIADDWCASAIDALVQAGRAAAAAGLIEAAEQRHALPAEIHLRWVELCVDAGLEGLDRAQQALASAYLRTGQPLLARAVAEDLMLRRSDLESVQELVLRIHAACGDPDPERSLRDLLEPSASAPSDVRDVEPVEPPSASAGDDVPQYSIAVDWIGGHEDTTRVIEEAPRVEAAADAVGHGGASFDWGALLGREMPSAPVPREPEAAPLPEMAPESEPVRPEVRDDAAASEPEPGPSLLLPSSRPPVLPSSYEIDLTDLLEELRQQPMAAPPQPQEPSPVPGGDAGNGGDAHAPRLLAAQQVAAGRVFAAAGLAAEAARAFERASKDVRSRFEAAEALAELHRSRGQMTEAVRWYDEAAHAPVADAAIRRPVLYDLAETLEAVGQPDRALAVLLDLLSEVEDYRDARARADRLLRVDAGG